MFTYIWPQEGSFSTMIRMAWKRYLSLFLIVCFFTTTNRAFAAADNSLSKVGKGGIVVAKSAAYGVAGGLVVGLASQVFKKKTKNIFLFGSLGMYAGILLGIYVLSTASGPRTYEGPDTYDDFSRAPLLLPEENLALMKTSSGLEKNSTELTLLHFTF